MRRLVVIASVLLAGVLSANSASAQTQTQTQTQTNITTKALPAASATVRAEAATINTPAQLAAAPAAVRRYFLAPARIVSTASRTATAAAAPGGCASLTVTENVYNAFHFIVVEAQTHISNWCWVRNLYGYWVIYTTPYGYFTENTHWGQAYCGTSDAFRGWVSMYWEYDAQAKQYFFPGYCVYPGVELVVYTAGQVYGNGGYSWQASD
jgi:hypothetical protein